MRKQHKTGRCPNCCPDGGAEFDRDYEWNEETETLVEVWRCRNCWEPTPVKVQKKRLDRMTPTQERLVKDLPAEACREHYSDDAQVYNLKVEFIRGDVYLSFEVRNASLPENSVGAIFPDRYSVAIGRHGRLSSYLPVRDKKGKRVPGKYRSVTSKHLWRHRDW